MQFQILCFSQLQSKVIHKAKDDALFLSSSESGAITKAEDYLGSTLHDAHHLARLGIPDDGNGVLVNRVEGDELGALIVVPESVLLLVTLC